MPTPSWIPAFLLTIFLGLVASGLYDDYSDNTIEQPKPVYTSGFIACLMPVGLRICLSRYWQMLGHEPGLAETMCYVCWTTGHALALYLTRGLLGGSYNSVLEVWTILGLVNGILTDRYSTFWALALRMLALCSWAIFLQPEKTVVCKSDCVIIGPNFRRIVWTLGHYGSQIGGILALCDSLLGCSVLWLRGFWVTSHESPEPLLQLIVNPLVILLICYIISMTVDIFGHVALHRWMKRRSQQV